MSLTARFRSPRALRLLGAALAALVGLILAGSPLGEWWSNRSYDWLFRLRPEIELAKCPVVIVEMDDDSTKALDQTSAPTWDRTLYAALIENLKGREVDTVAFDILFRDPNTNDVFLLKAAASHGRVLFGGRNRALRAPDGQIIGHKIERPWEETLSQENVGIVETSFSPDRAVRLHYAGAMGIPSLAWRLAQVTMAERPTDQNASRWVNYYARPGRAIPHISFWQVLSNRVPESLSFTNKVVFVGARAEIGPLAGSGTDYLPTPYGDQMPGVELNATTYLNLARGDWLTRWPPLAEAVLLALLGGGGGYLLGGRAPWRAAVFGLAGGAGVLGLAVGLFWFAHFWFPWLIVLGAQLPCAVAWSVLVRDALAVAASPEAPTVIEAPRAPGLAPTRQIDLANSPGGAAQAGSFPAPVISDHTLLRCVGRGAYGEVWLARDVIGTFHAVKIVYRNSFDSDTPFDREFKGIQRYTPISRSHPGWVHVLHVGRNDEQGYFYTVMEPGDDEVTGPQIHPDTYQPKNLARELKRRGKFPLGECLELGVALADALEHLHQSHLIHRDIKPSNIIFVKGAPKFADIGLVTDLVSKGRETSYLGTEGYIAPEGPGAAAADVFSLGKLLYEISMGRDRLEFPELPTAVLDSAVDSDVSQFAEILMKACEDDRTLRYQSAAALRDALQELRRRTAAPS